MNRHGNVIALGAFQGNLISEQGDNSTHSFSNLVFTGLSLLGSQPCNCMPAPFALRYIFILLAFSGFDI